MSSRRAWCQSRLNSSCTRASPSVKLNISLRRWTPRTVCTARLGRPLSAQYIGARSSSSIRGSASFRKTSAQLPSRRLAFFGVTRNWDCQRLSCGSRARNMLPSLARALPQRPFPTLSSHCPRRTRGFYEGIRVAQRGTSYIPNNFGRQVFIDYSLDQHLARQRNHGVAVYAILNILPAIVNVNSLAIFWVVEGENSAHHHSGAHFRPNGEHRYILELGYLLCSHRRDWT